MAGGRGPGGRFASAALVDRARDIRDSARGRYAVAKTPLRKLAVAHDYARSAAAACLRAGIGGAGQVLGSLTVALMSAGDELTAALEQAGRGDQ